MLQGALPLHAPLELSAILVLVQLSGLGACSLFRALHDLRPALGALVHVGRATGGLFQVSLRDGLVDLGQTEVVVLDGARFGDADAAMALEVASVTLATVNDWRRDEVRPLTFVSNRIQRRTSHCVTILFSCGYRLFDG